MISSSKVDSPTYAINVLSKKLYVSTELRSIQAIGGNPATGSLNPFTFEKEQHFRDLANALRAIVGPPLEKANQSVLERSAAYLKGTGTELQEQSIQLLAWIRSFVVLCSIDSLYGKANPIRLSSDLEKALLLVTHPPNQVEEISTKFKLTHTKYSY